MKDNSGAVFYTPKQTMQLFDISRPTFTAWCKKGVFKKVNIPNCRRVYVTAESVDRILNQK